MAEKENTITIGHLNCKPEIDPYHRNTRTPTRTYVTYDPYAHYIGVEQLADTGCSGVPYDIWSGKILSDSIHNYPSEDEIQEAIWAMEDEGLFARVQNGQQEHYDGQRYSYDLTDDGQEAWEEISSRLNDLTSAYVWVDVLEYLDTCWPDYIEYLQQGHDRDDLLARIEEDLDVPEDVTRCVVCYDANDVDRLADRVIEEYESRQEEE